MTMERLSWQSGSMVDCVYWINSYNEAGKDKDGKWLLLSG
jgi:hypothetical protein